MNVQLNPCSSKIEAIFYCLPVIKWNLSAKTSFVNVVGLHQFPLCLTSILVEILADINYNLIYFVSLVLIEANLNLFELNLRKLSCKPRVMWPIADAITCYLSWNVFMANLPCIWVKVVLFYQLISYSSQPDAIWVECIEQSYWQSLLCWDLPLVETSLMLLFEWLFKQACTNLSLTLSSSIVVDIRS